MTSSRYDTCSRSMMASVSDATVSSSSILHHRGRYLRSPMYISLHPAEQTTSRSASLWSSQSEHQGDDEHCTEHPATRGSKSIPTFLPDIISTPLLPSKGISETPKHRCARLPLSLTRSQSLSDYWTNFRRSQTTSKYIQPIRRQHFFRAVSSSKNVIHKAPVSIKTFEESLLPTHNIFFAGRPPTPKIKKLKAKEPVNSIIVEAIPVKVQRVRRSRRGKKVKFVDAVDRVTDENTITSHIMSTKSKEPAILVS